MADDIRFFRNRVQFKGATGSPAWETALVIWHGRPSSPEAKPKDFPLNGDWTPGGGGP